MSYRPITDVWILARPKVKYYGAYPSGFLQRARDLLGVALDDDVLHVCGGRVKDYPYSGFGEFDETLDIDPTLAPTYVADASDPYATAAGRIWSAILADPPYSLADAKMYGDGSNPYPSPDAIVKHGLAAVGVGGRVGILHTVWPRYPKDIARQVAVVAVYVGNGNVGRTYSVFERTR